jgi:hypothetical protein
VESVVALLVGCRERRGLGRREAPERIVGRRARGRRLRTPLEQRARVIDRNGEIEPLRAAEAGRVDPDGAAVAIAEPIATTSCPMRTPAADPRGIVA